MARIEGLRVFIDAKGALLGAAQFGGATRRMGTAAETLRARLHRLTLGLTGLTAGVAGFAIFRKMTGTIARFEKTLAEVQVVTRATGDDFKRLNVLARELGATTQFTAAQAGEGMLALARSGMNVDQVISALPQTLAFATAASIELGNASDMVANTLKQFGLNAAETARVTDSLLIVANNANTDVTQMGQALEYAGTMAGALGVPLATTSAALGVLANQGIKGSMAGTQLRGVFRQLLNITDKSAAALEELGLSAYDVNPAIHDLDDIFDKFNERAATMEDKTRLAGIMLDIFGSRPLSAALALTKFNDTISTNIQLQQDMTGHTKEAAAAIENTLENKIKSLVSAWEELNLVMGDGGVGGALRGLVALITSTLRTLAGMQDKVESFNTAAKILAFTIKFLAIQFMLLAGFKGIKMVTLALIQMIKFTLRATRSLKALKVVMAANWISLLATALAGIIVLWQEYTNSQERAKRSTEAMANSQRELAEAMVDAAATKGMEKLKNLARGYSAVTGSLEELRNGLNSYEKTLNRVQIGTDTMRYSPLTPAQSRTGERRQYTQEPTKAGEQFREEFLKLKPIAIEMAKIFEEQMATAERALKSAQAAAGDFGTATEAELKAVRDAAENYSNVMRNMTTTDISEVFADMGQEVPNFETAVAELAKVISHANYELGVFKDRGDEAFDPEQQKALEKGKTALIAYTEALIFETSISRMSKEAQDAARVAREVNLKVMQAGGEANGIVAQGIMWLNASLREQIALQEEANAKSEQYEKLVSATSTTIDSMIEELEFELSVMRMSNEEREKEIYLREVNALKIGLEGDELAAMIEKIKELLSLRSQVAEGGDSTEETKTPYESTMEDFERSIDELAYTMKHGAEAGERYAFIQDMITESTRENIELTAEQIAALEMKYDAYKEMTDAYAKQNEEALISEEQFARAVTNSIMSVINGTATIEEAFLGLIETMVQMVIQALIFKAIMGAITGGAGAAAPVPTGAKGMVFSGGGRGTIEGYAFGGIVDRPTTFSMPGGGRGLMGEAGAEAVMPLTRMPDGRLGVASEGGGGGGNTIIHMTVHAQDADSFRKSKKQITRELSRGIRAQAHT